MTQVSFIFRMSHAALLTETCESTLKLLPRISQRRDA